jgi:putative glutamine amidotransferase
MTIARRPRIGVSIAFEAPRDDRILFRGKWLQYVEQSMLHAVARAGGVPLLLASHEPGLCDALEACDGLLLTGGSDVAPGSYAESPLRPEWSGDPQRDAYELELLAGARQRDLPVLGICRGCQLLAVGSGGKLYQDIVDQHEDALTHRCQERYDRLEHELRIEGESLLARVLAETPLSRVNSVHHQAIRHCGDLRPVAWAPDGIVEAVEGPGPRFELGIQWHPEWMADELGQPVFRAFIAAAAASLARFSNRE